MKLYISQSPHKVICKDLPGFADILAARYNDVETLWNLSPSPSSFLANGYLTTGSTRSPFGSISEVPVPSISLIRCYPMSVRSRINHLPRGEWSMKLDR
jgi:hypothetical protein